MSLKVVFFDLIGVVVEASGTGSGTVLKTLYGSLPNKTISETEFYARYKRYVVGEISSAEFWEGTVDDHSTFEQRYIDSYRLDPYFMALAKTLRLQYRLALLSNHPARWMDLLIQKHGFNEIFEKIFVSGKLQMKKTDPAVYPSIVREMGVHATECAMVDDQSKNLKVAARYKIKTIHLKRNADSSDFTADSEIASLEQLHDAMGTLES